ncbi:MAG: SAM-dependent methyltransferase [Bacteroidetes bacterium]|jgi:tRNA U34 5-methylaminomethyl-2-thiouridine-forming methyltransferase MnmC|nr:SAM-dependent methyltransferase [Bacteroidota bacterium]
MERKIITTDDGSHSIYIPELNENYHSTHGAIQESLHVFIEAGLKKVLADNLSSVLNILEVGMGTGLNLLLSYIETKEITVSINYTSIEAYPLDKNFIQQLNYTEILSSSLKIPVKGVFEKIHDSEWDEEVELSENFTLKKIKNKLQKVNLKANTFDLIYYDAFGPPTQPEMWTDEIFTSLFSSLKSNGCLVTYCAKGEVKRILKRVGFTVESLPGPPGKREMVRAFKILMED